jgi:transglutaminase-like putative cysteine protease
MLFAIALKRILCLLTIMLLALASHPAWAGLFGPKPPPQWALDAAKSETPASAGDAGSVILISEIVVSFDSSGRAIEHIREARRILKPKGRDAFCSASYNADQKIISFHAWTIAADGRQYPAQDTDIAEKGDTDVPQMLSTSKTRVAIPPAIDVGAVLVCESEELLEAYLQETTWHVQYGIPVLSEALEIDLPPGRAYTVAWHGHEPVQPVEVAPNHWRWEIKNLPALDLRDLPLTPAWEALAARMTVQWGDAAVQGAENQWRILGKWVTTLEADRSNPSPEITTAVQSMVANAPDFYTKLSRITSFIQKDVRYFIVMRGIGGMQANYAQDIYRNRYGDCKDKSTLLIAMAQAAGLHAFYVAVDTQRGFVDPALPSIDGNHMIAAIEVPAGVQDARLKTVIAGREGKRYLIFDPTDERTPLGNLPPPLQGGYGLLCAGEASQLLALPVLDPSANTSDRKGSFTLTADGTLAGSVDVLRTGTTGADQRLYVKYTEEKDRRQQVETAVAHDVPGVVLSSVRFVEPSELDKPMELHYSFSAAQYARPAASMLLVRPRVIATYGEFTANKPRTIPIEFAATGRWHDSYEIKLPDGYIVDETPDPVDLDLDFASYHSAVTAKGNLLRFEREFVVRQLELPATQWPAFRKLESAILSDEKGTAVLKKQ